jgi:LPXTG-motif cell wall-anchored protein
VNSVRSRLLAAATTLVLAGAAVLGGTAAASAAAGPSLEVDHVNWNATAAQSLEFAVTQVGGCAISNSYWRSWVFPTGGSWEEVGPSGGDITYQTATTGTFSIPAVGYGNSVRVGVYATFDCDGEQSERFLDITPARPSATFEGQAYKFNGMGGLVYPENAPAALLRVSDGPDATPVATGTVNSWGGFSLTAPLASTADYTAQYRIRVASVGLPVAYYTVGASGSSPSTTDWNSATVVTLSTPISGRYGVFIPRPWSYSGLTSVSGVAYGPQGTPVVATATLYALGTPWTPVASQTTNGSGAFTLSATVAQSGDENRQYAIAVDFGGGQVRYYASGSDAAHPSPSDTASAAVLTPATFSASSYGVYAAPVVPTNPPADDDSDDSDDDSSPDPDTDTDEPSTDEPSTDQPGFETVERDLALALDLRIGGSVSGSSATATAKGLEEGADYDIVVRSTPQTLATGSVPTGGVVTRGVTLPTLEAGWHSLTFTSTWQGGGSAVARVWFLVSADGKLVQTSLSAPALAETGSDGGAGSLFLGSILLAAGAGLVVLRRRVAHTR